MASCHGLSGVRRLLSQSPALRSSASVREILLKPPMTSTKFPRQCPAVKHFARFLRRMKIENSTGWRDKRPARKADLTDERGDQYGRKHAAAMHEMLLRQKNGIVVQVHINSFAPDCKKICSKSSPVPRHSRNADALDNERFQQFIQRICVHPQNQTSRQDWWLRDFSHSRLSKFPAPCRRLRAI